MALAQTITVDHIATPHALASLLQSVDALPNNPPFLFFSSTTRSLVLYVPPSHAVYLVPLPFLASAFSQRSSCASTLKSLLENGPTTKVFFDARATAKTLFDSCGIRLSIKPGPDRSHIHEVQMMELALRRSDNDRVWLASLDRCIAQHSTRSLNTITSNPSTHVFDPRILHLPPLWEKYHARLAQPNNSFWVARIREATSKRLDVACGVPRGGYSVDGARSAWDQYSIEQDTDSWNDDVLQDGLTHGAWLGDEHWAKFAVL